MPIHGGESRIFAATVGRSSGLLSAYCSNYAPEKRSEGYLEFFPPDELFNPEPGKPVIEVYDTGGHDLETMMLGDMLHYLPAIDPKFAEYRDRFRESITPEQEAVDRRAYERMGDKRPYDKWFDVSRLDAYLRGFLAPDKNNEWADAYTPEQRELLGEMERHLRAPRIFKK